MATSSHPGFAVVQVRTELCLDELKALYWDALVDRLRDADRAAYMVINDYTAYTGREAVVPLVRKWLTWYGERSVECGPRNDYPEIEGFENRLRRIVAKAFKIVY